MKKCLLSAGAAVVMCAFALGLSAGDPPAKKKETKDDSMEAVELVTTAGTLSEYGRKTNSPEALIAAAGMLKRVRPSKLLELAEGEDKEAAKPEKGELPSLYDEADALLAEAKKMSKDDPAVVALADLVGNRKVSRGVAGGPRIVQNLLAGKSHHSFSFPIVGGAPLAVGITSPGNTYLHVKIRVVGKGYSVLLADGVGVAGARTCLPPSNGTVHVFVQNPTKAGTAYRIVTN